MLKELINITEGADKQAMVFVDQTLLEIVDDPRQVVKDLLILARQKVVTDALKVSAKTKVEISPQEKYANVIVAVSILMDENNDVSVLLYFGGLTDPSTFAVSGLLHAAELCAIVDVDKLL